MTSHHPIRKVVNPEPTVIPDKLYFRIGDVAKLCDVPAYVLRFWETEFPQLKPNKGGTGQRLYRKRDVETALRIKTLLYDQGYTIPGARQIFSAEPKVAEPKVKDAPAETAPQLAAAPAPVPEPAQDLGASIREQAQRRQQLTALRDELRSIADILSRPASSSQPPPAPNPAPEALATRVKPMRPRLVLEPKPDTKQQRSIDQGDLFPSE